MTGPELTVGRDVVGELVGLAAVSVPGVVRVGLGGPGWLARLRGAPIRVRIRHDRVAVRLHIVARPDQPLGTLTAQVRAAVAATVERFLGLELDAVTVIVDGVGG